MSYNATVYSIYTDPDTGETFEWGTGVAEVMEFDGKLEMLRGNGATCTNFEGKVIEVHEGDELIKLGLTPGRHAAYHAYLLLSNPNVSYTIVRDNCQGYRDRLVGLDLPPTYKVR